MSQLLFFSLLPLVALVFVEGFLGKHPQLLESGSESLAFEPRGKKKAANGAYLGVFFGGQSATGSSNQQIIPYHIHHEAATYVGMHKLI